ncbi:accessory gene regulator B family protein [Clostridium sp. JS66]|uniref:accessory gene regulator ArgB-like protein n=1 Tax=Clostridium sp. JS66 TaxID=3064705 RepID=UPI00298DB591|nr:accessory gene regulator B family protein [Clostridium sp. JS66]WPC40188.1 accessory gene regulator B family protein [Clostridium sp. JS66]
MINKLALQLTSLICTETYNNTKDRARIQYGLAVILNEGFKTVFLLLFFNIIHKEKYFYFSLLIMLSTRLFAGGVHLKGTLYCLITTTLLFILTSVLAPLVPKLPVVCYLLVGIISLMIVLVRAPICSVRRPIKDNKTKLQYKFTAALFVTIWAIILLFLESTTYVNCGFSTILVQSVQLVLVKKPTL